MIELQSGDIHLAPSLHAALEKLLRLYSIPDTAERIVLNGRQTAYYSHRQGLHPIEVQFKRESPSKAWQVVCMTSFSYPEESSIQVEPELYFHLLNRWCYQPNAGAADLSHPEVLELLMVWMNALARHLSRNVFDELELSVVRQF
ncbi:DUF2787 domain-containing protein [Vibrio cholerae]|nr:DUF2787 domain-containing protein [Vibrio cholerae]